MYYSLLQTVRWLRVFLGNGVQEDLPIVHFDPLDPFSYTCPGRTNYLLFLTEPRPCFRMVRRRSRNVFEMPRESAIPPNRIPIGTREREPLSNVPIHIPPPRSVFRYVPCMDETPDPCTFPCLNVKPPKV